MKKIILSLALISCAISMTAQNKEESEMPHRNEFKVNIAMTSLALTPTVSYEFLSSKEISIGASLGYNFEKHNYNHSGTIQAIPFVRWFLFGAKKTPQRRGAGFFIEGNIGIFSGSKEYDGSERMGVAAGVGLAAGWKYVTPGNWVAEFHAGGGRLFSDISPYHDGFPRLGISLGKRF